MSVEQTTGMNRMDYERQALNGCYAMLCEALRAWHEYVRHDHTRATAAKVLKDVYAYELHSGGGGCAWRRPETDREWASNGMKALGLDPEDFDFNQVILARLLDGDPKHYETLTGRRLDRASGAPHGGEADRRGVVESLHNAFRRITVNWDSVLCRPVMDANLGRMIPMAAHAVRVEREGGTPDLRPLLALCRRKEER